MPAKKKPTAKKTAKKPPPPAPTDAQLNALIDVVDDAHELCAALTEAQVAVSLDDFARDLAQASKHLARIMRGMAALAAGLDPAAYAAAEAKARQLPAARAPATVQ